MGDTTFYNVSTGVCEKIVYSYSDFGELGY